MFPTEEPQRPQLRGFEVLERLGAGGVGTVYLGRSKSGRLVAIKMIGDPSAVLDEAQQQVLAREASLCARLVHPCIVQVRAFVQDRGYAALVFEYVQGVTLARLLRFIASQGARLPDGAAFTVLERVLSALAFAHAHKDEGGILVPIVHRDVSPANVLMDWEGNVKLTDFGMAKMMGTSTGTRTGLVLGTLGCMAPEQARGDSVTERADVYAAALLTWRLATGLSPFAKFRNDEVELLRAMRNPRLAALSTLRPELPRPILDAVSIALAPDPAQRNITAEALRTAIAGSIDCLRGEVELRALLKGSRRQLESMVASEGADRSYSISDSTGQTTRYEDVALTFDRDLSRLDDAPASNADGPLDAMKVDVRHELPTKPVITMPAPPRGPMVSLDEVQLFSELSAADARFDNLIASSSGGAPLALDQPSPAGSGVVAPNPGAPLETRLEPDRVDGVAGVPRGRQPAPAARMRLMALVALVSVLGIGVGAFLAWLFLH